MSVKPRVRIAPSPTGPIHVGTLHTALFNWLFTRNHGGTFVLRLEDTDQERSRSEWIHHIYHELQWLGLTWDEGPDIGGPFGPYAQMQRLDLYHTYARRLLESGRAYRCYCTPEELDAEREGAIAAGVAYRYSRKCLQRSPEEIARLEVEGAPSCIRFKIPDIGEVVIDDMIRGRISVPIDVLGDPVIVRPTGIPLYNFAVIVDDVQMEITHVIRGEEHISNTPIQILLAQALGSTPPRYAHLGLMLNPDRTKMSKRHGNAFAGWYRENGYLPEALLNFLALLGWAPGDEREIMNPEEMIRAFRLDRVSKSGSIFDLQKLNWMNGQYIRSLSLADLTQRAIPFLQRSGLIGEDAASTPEMLQPMMALVQERSVTLADIPDQVRFFFQNQVEVEPELAAKWFTAPNLNGLSALHHALSGLSDFTAAAVEATCRSVAEGLEIKAKQLFQIARLAVTGRLVSPPLFESMALLGQARTLERIERVLKR